MLQLWVKAASTSWPEKGVRTITVEFLVRSTAFRQDGSFSALYPSCGLRKITGTRTAFVLIFHKYMLFFLSGV